MPVSVGSLIVGEVGHSTRIVLAVNACRADTSLVANAVDEDAKRAGAVLARLLGGKDKIVDPGGGSRQSRDLDVVLPNGKFIAVEVTRFTSQRATEQYVQVGKQDQPMPGLQSTWIVGAPQSFLVNELRRKLIPLLNALGNEALDRRVRADATGDTTKDLLGLGVRYAVRAGGSGQGRGGRIIFNPPPQVGTTSSDMIVEVANEVLARPDNLAKLRVPDADSRDLFVWVDHLRLQHLVAMWADGTPTRSPNLIQPVDRVWIATATDRPLLWAYSTLGGWERPS